MYNCSSFHIVVLIFRGKSQVLDLFRYNRWQVGNSPANAHHKGLFRMRMKVFGRLKRSSVGDQHFIWSVLTQWNRPAAAPFRDETNSHNLLLMTNSAVNTDILDYFRKEECCRSFIMKRISHIWQAAHLFNKVRSAADTSHMSTQKVQLKSLFVKTATLS